jgi:hypothetical protein
VAEAAAVVGGGDVLIDEPGHRVEPLAALGAGDPGAMDLELGGVDREEPAAMTTTGGQGHGE